MFTSNPIINIYFNTSKTSSISIPPNFCTSFAASLECLLDIEKNVFALKSKMTKRWKNFALMKNIGNIDSEFKIGHKSTSAVPGKILKRYDSSCKLLLNQNLT